MTTYIHSRFWALLCTATAIMLILVSLGSPALDLSSLQLNRNDAALAAPLLDAPILALYGSSRKNFSNSPDYRLSATIEENIRFNLNTEQESIRYHYFIASSRHSINILRLQLNI